MKHDCSLKRKTVLITGASSGLGKEFARQYAKKGCHLILTARSKDKLEALKAKLEEEYGIQVLVIPCDLSREYGAHSLYEAVMKSGWDVDILINNAGAGKQGSVVNTKPSVMADLITLNITSPTLLAHYFGARMLSRNRGQILFVSSLAGFQPEPYFNVYGPCKAYELFLASSMYGEMLGSQVTVSVLCPGPIKTNWAKNAGKKDSFMAQKPEKIVEAAIEGMDKKELVIIPTLLFKTGRAVLGNLPKKLTSPVVALWQKSLISASQPVSDDSFLIPAADTNFEPIA